MSDVIVGTLIAGAFGLVGAIIAGRFQLQAAKIKAKDETKLVKKSGIKFLTPLVVISFLIFGILGFIVGYWIYPSLRENQNLSLFTLRVSNKFDFENIQDLANIKPFTAQPERDPPNILIADNVAHTGNSSLRIMANIQETSVDKYQYVGIGLSNYHYPDIESDKVIAASAWIFVPESETLKDNDLRAQLFGYSYGNNDEFIGTFSKNVILIPGKWVPIFWGASNKFELSDGTTYSTDGIFTELYLTFWDSSKPYNGSIYIDDVLLYQYKE